METKELELQLTELKTGLQNFTKAEIAAQIKNIQDILNKLTADIGDTNEGKAKITGLQTTLTEIKTATDKLSEWQVKKDEADKKNQEAIDKLLSDKRKTPLNGKSELKTFNTILAETIERNAEQIKKYRPLIGEGQKTVSFDLFTEDEKKSFEKVDDQIEVKAVGDMSIAANFPNATNIYQDVRGPLIETPYNKVYLADLIPNGTSGGSSVVYPKEGSTDGGVASWTDYTQNKAQVDFNITSANSPFVWGAGYVIIQRDMLDDIPFMTSYLQSRLLISLKTWENNFIVNGAGAVLGLQAVATPYSENQGLTIPVDKLVDASYGQIVDDTNEYYTGNMAIVRSRDLVTKIGLNKASGSGEYNLPPNSVVFRADGTVSIGNLTVVGTTQIPVDTFYSLDRNATLFIRRIQPELRLFEDSTLAKKNQLMWRIEERATFVVFNNSAVVKGVLHVSP